MYFSLYTQEIRLVDIHPGQFSSPIHCTLRHASVSNNPPYKALSYVWGAANATRRCITVDGHPHLVTVNLEFALRRIRQPDVVTTFWIDALSINQDDNEERSIQVGMMRDIYAKATEVVIYLGEAPHHEFAGLPSKNRSPTALSVFYGDHRDQEQIAKFQRHCLPIDKEKKSGTKKKLNYAHEVCCLISLLAQISDLGNVPPFNAESRPSLDSFYQRNVFEALRYMVRSTWWNRIWVVQEVVVPRNVILIYDTTTAHWEMFVKAAQSYTKNSFSTVMSSFPKEYSDVLSFFSRIVLDIHHLRCRWENAETTDLLSLLRQFSIRKASDDRDKVYALLSLVTDVTAYHARIIEPDYSVDTVTVFKNTVLGIIKSTGSLSILTGDLGRKNRQDLPSWAVDWSATSDDVDRRRAEDTENYNASAGVAVRVHSSGEDTIDEVSKFLNKLETKLRTEGVTVPPSASHCERFTLLLSSSEWEKYCLYEELPGSQRNNFECLQAIEHYLAIRGDLLWVRELDSVLDCPGLYKGQVVGIGDACFSHDDLDTLVQNWAKVIQYYSGTDSSTALYQSLEEAFLRALCADLAYPGGDASGSQRCRATEEDLEDIVTWILRSGGFSGPKRLWKRLSSRQVAMGFCSNVLASIGAATFRRRIFFTDKGFVGTGPAGIQRGDALYLLVGGRAPFILRKSGKCKVPLVSSRRQLVTMERNCYELIGDCYVHGLMDGEGMKPWKEAAAKSSERTMEQEKMCVQQQERWEQLRQQFAADDSIVELLKRPEPDSWLLTASGTADTVYSFSITVIKVVERPEFGPWLLRSSGTSEKHFVSDLNPHGRSNKLTPGTLLYSLKLPDYHASKWSEKQGMVAWIKDLAVLDTYGMIGAFQNSAKKLEEHLDDLKNTLDDATAALQGSELEIEDRTRVLIV